jgi:glycerol uptake facilitator-like aquaporin
MKFTLRARLIAEFIGTAFLVSAVVGSGVMGERLAGGNVAIALLANTIATWAALVALIATFGSVSEAHFNPVVTLADAIYGGLSCSDAVAYISSQTVRLVYRPSVGMRYDTVTGRGSTRWERASWCRRN